MEHGNTFSQMKGVSDIRDKYTHIKDLNRYPIELFSLNEVLSHLTANKPPKELIQEMLELSQN